MLVQPRFLHIDFLPKKFAPQSLEAFCQIRRIKRSLSAFFKFYFYFGMSFQIIF